MLRPSERRCCFHLRLTVAVPPAACDTWTSRRRDATRSRTARRGSTRSIVCERGAVGSSQTNYSTTKLRSAAMLQNTMVVSVCMCVRMTMLALTFRRHLRTDVRSGCPACKPVVSLVKLLGWRMFQRCRRVRHTTLLSTFLYTSHSTCLAHEDSRAHAWLKYHTTERGCRVRVSDVAERCCPHLGPHAALSGDTRPRLQPYRRHPWSHQHVSLFNLGEKKCRQGGVLQSRGPAVHSSSPVAMSSVVNCVSSRGATRRLASPRCSHTSCKSSRSSGAAPSIRAGPPASGPVQRRPALRAPSTRHHRACLPRIATSMLSGAPMEFSHARVPCEARHPSRIQSVVAVSSKTGTLRLDEHR